MKPYNRKIKYNQAELSQLDLTGIKELKIWSRFENSYTHYSKTIHIKCTKNIKKLPPLLKISELFIYETKIRKIDSTKIELLSTYNNRIKSIKKDIVIKFYGNKLKDHSYTYQNHGNNKYLKFLFFA